MNSERSLTRSTRLSGKPMIALIRMRQHETWLGVGLELGLELGLGLVLGLGLGLV